MDTLALERFKGSPEEKTGNSQDSDNQTKSNHIQIIRRKPSETAIEKIQRRKLEREEARLKAEAEAGLRAEAEKKVVKLREVEARLREEETRLKNKQDDLKKQYLQIIPRFLCEELVLGLDLETDGRKRLTTPEFLKIAFGLFSIDEILGYMEDYLLPRIEKENNKVRTLLRVAVVNLLITVAILFSILIGNHSSFHVFLFYGTFIIMSTTLVFSFFVPKFPELYSTIISKIKKIGLDPIKVLEEALIAAKTENK